MNSEDKFHIEYELLEYFTQFHEKGISISLFKGETEIPVKVDSNGNPNQITTRDKADRVYLIPPVENNVYNPELFESFYQLLFAKQTAPEPLFIEWEIKIISEKYTDEVKKENPILRYWLYFLNEKQKAINEMPKAQNSMNIDSNSLIEKIKLNIDNALLELHQGIKGNFDFYNQLLAFKNEMLKPENNIEYYQHQYAVYLSVFRDLINQIECLRENCNDYPGDMYNLFDETGQSAKNLANDIELSNFLGIAQLYLTGSILKHVVNVKYSTYIEQLKITKKAELKNNSQNKKNEKIKPEIDNIEILSQNLSNYHFFELEKVKSLKQEKRESLISLINSNKVPYKIAMLNHTGFIDLIDKKYSKNKEKLYKIISDILNEEPNNIKNNILALKPQSKHNKPKEGEVKRYNTLEYLDTVKNDYENL